MIRWEFMGARRKNGKTEIFLKLIDEKIDGTNSRLRGRKKPPGAIVLPPDVRRAD